MTGREERIRIAREIMNMGVNRWIPDEQLRADLRQFVEMGSTSGLHDTRVGALIQRVQSLPPGQVSETDIQAILRENVAPLASSFARDEQGKNLINDVLSNVPVGADDATMQNYVQDAVMRQMGGALNQLENQNPEMAGLFMAAMSNTNRDKKGMREFYQNYASRLPADSPNRAEIEAYLEAGMPSPNDKRRFRQYLRESARRRNPHMNDAQLNAEVDRLIAMMPEEDPPSLFDRLGQLPSGCALVLVYFIVIGVLGVIMLGLLLALSSSVVLSQSAVGQAAGAALLFMSVGTGIFLWIRGQTRSTLHTLRFFGVLALFGAGIFLLISSDTIDVQAIQDDIATDPERALFLGIAVLSMTTTVFLWVRNLLNTVIIFVLLLIVGGVLAFGAFTGAIDLSAIFSGASDGTGGFQ